MPLEIKGLDTLISALDKLVNGIDGNVKQIVEQEADRIAGEARSLAPVDGGYLREKIQTRVTETEDKIAGEVYNMRVMQHMWSLGPDLLDRRQALRLRV